jgi:SAM-dependent methyltransferase
MREFPRLYAGLYRTFRADLPFWRRMAFAAGGPLLELGSGTGRVAADLARRGFVVTGIDADPAMIAWAERHRPPLPAGALSYVQGDIADFRLPRGFGLVLCPCNTLSLLSRDQAQRTLRCSRQHLRPGGVLAAELAHPREVQTGGIDPSSPLAAFLDAETGGPVQVFAEQRFDGERRAAEVEWRLDDLLRDGRVKRHLIRQTLQLWQPAEVQRAMQVAGFAGSSLLGGYQAQNYDEHSKRMLVVAVAP